MTVLKTSLLSAFAVAFSTSAFAMNLSSPLDAQAQLYIKSDLVEPQNATGALSLSEALKSAGGFAVVIDAAAERQSFVVQPTTFQEAKLGS